MTVISILLLVALIALQFLHMRERDQMRVEQNLERAAVAKERAQLLERIQRPEVRQVEPGEIQEMIPPKDVAEMAYVGEIVPEFIQVGGDE